MPTHVVSVCTLNHRDVWQQCSSLLGENVDASKYTVFVPSAELEEFRRITPGYIEVAPEESLDFGFFAPLKAAVEQADNTRRYGWYLQQFLKIQALLSSEAERIVLWDADCIPLKKIPLFSDEGLPIYMKATEYHRPYFEAIKRLTGLSRSQDFSFVSPGLPFLKSWATQFVSQLESTHANNTWFEAIISAVDFREESGFSEYETLGSWVASEYEGNFLTRSASWERHGQKLFGEVKDLSHADLLEISSRADLEVISFELWDTVKTPRSSSANWQLWGKLLRQIRQPGTTLRKLCTAAKKRTK